ncbi:YlbF family regulator [Bacillus andreraoultii]|uniref:YlbF family regulator n=1 Tax=Bacillus andreraoultii TaxID=1499685 RepID=UPI0005397A15|nr:YlbF family regulator [Bacillus andreraoultii]
MFATLESVEIIDHAETLAKMIIESDIADEYRQCLYIMNTDLETQKKIKKFVKLKEQYEEVQRFGRYHPDYSKIMTEVRLAKREMDLDENVAKFKIAENALQQLLDEISLLIGRSVSERVKVATGSPFFETKSSGGCSTGGSCGCSA